MIYICNHCGFKSYHQGEIENPFCPECHYNKSEVVPVPGEFKAKIRSDVDIERLCDRSTFWRDLENCTTVPGTEVSAEFMVYFRLDRPNGLVTSFNLSLDEARELLELPEEKLHKTLTGMDTLAAKSGRSIPITKEVLQNAQFDIMRVVQDTASNLSNEIKVEKLREVSLGDKDKEPKTFKDILNKLIIKLKHMRDRWRGYAHIEMIAKSREDMHNVAEWAENEIVKLDEIRDIRYAHPGTELEVIEKILRWIDDNVHSENAHAIPKQVEKSITLHAFNDLYKFIEQQMKEE